MRTTGSTNVDLKIAWAILQCYHGDVELCGLDSSWCDVKAVPGKSHAFWIGFHSSQKPGCKNVMDSTTSRCFTKIYKVPHILLKFMGIVHVCS